MRKLFILFIMLIICTAMSAEPIKHKFLLIDEGKCNLLYVDENDSKKNWIVRVDYETPRDMQLIGKNLVLIGHDKGYTEYDIATGKAVKIVDVFNYVTSARRLANGNTVITRSIMDKVKGIYVLEVSPTNEVISKVALPKEYGDFVRLIRHTAKGTILLAVDMQILEIDTKGNIIWKTSVAGYDHMWKAVRLSNGNTLSAGGYGPFITEVDPKGALVRKLGAKDSMPAEIGVHFYATFQLLSNGNIVVANWQGHGEGNGKKGTQLFEMDPKGAVVWKWSKSDIISSLQGVMILDGLDTNVLNDERNGVVEPVK